MQVIVLGMRSGSSVTTRLINMLGLSAGPEADLLPPNEQNPKGFWENRNVVRLNDRLLKTQLCGWNTVSQLDETRILPEHHPAEAEEAREIIRVFDAQQPWVLKDPRLTLLLPFWKPLLSRPLFVIIYRHPLEVALSLKSHHSIPLPAGLALWEQYARLALRHTHGAPRLLVSYNDTIKDPIAEVQRMHAWLQASGVDPLAPPDNDAILDFVDPALHRERSLDPNLEAMLSAEQQHLYTALRDDSALTWTDIPPLAPLPVAILQMFDEIALRRWNEKVLRERLAAAGA